MTICEACGQAINPKKKFSRIQAKEVLDFLNKKTGKNYKPVDVNISLILDRLNQGSDVQTMKSVVAKKYMEWKGTEMEKYLRPLTLFNKSKFAQYEGELEVVSD